ncbi:hypothetical protein [Prevotella sp. 10(H)]|uniref:hypothetical protein n=1 Tax=Prevotella sp. 10(H) TaxID=1158294 RepID=UPI0004A6B202|nr:hypothetical protein [Prevotella sp. 10(H)]
MLQQRKKDYLIRLLEELMKKINQMLNKDEQLTDSQKQDLLKESFEFFNTHYSTFEYDTAEELISKIPDVELLEQYPRLLMMQYDLSIDKNKKDLRKALTIVEFLQNTDSTYSWDRVILREDILRRLDENN